ncbi:MAG: glucose-6-phosphate isomerase, partial [Bacteroidota bacterium]
MSFHKLASFFRLQELSQQHADLDMRDLFNADSNRAEQFSMDLEGMFLDYSKNRIDSEIWNALISLSEEAKVQEGIRAMFNGEHINQTEDRAVLHVALRMQEGEELIYKGQNIIEDVVAVRKKCFEFADKVHSGAHLGATGRHLTDVVNIGIGGSDLGTVMVHQALQQEEAKLNAHFVSNVDGFHLEQTLSKLDPETTLVVVVSKTFTTQETMANAGAAKDWLVNALGEKAVGSHFIAVSTNISGAVDFGIDEQNIFGFWNWVGGRYSLWGAVGMSVILAYGAEVFTQLLEGARSMDKHFRDSKSKENMPVILALLGIWYNNFLDADSHAILPYAQGLNRFPAYLQQADMESNGKRNQKDGAVVNFETGPIIWGEAGTNGQHAFYQLIHQGTKLIPCDFIGVIDPMSSYESHHKKLLANCIAQSEALMQGKSREVAFKELVSAGKEESEARKLSPFKEFPGNRPSNTLLLDKLTPRNVGKLIALYEHKIFVQGWLWNVYSYDQWGVELGKILAKNILENTDIQHDASTNQLLKRA